MKEIHIDESAESWLGGKPEVKINVYGQKLDANTGLIVVSELGFVDYQFTSNNNTTDTGLNSMLADWSFFDDSTYYPILNINMKEYDNLTGTMRFSMEAKCGYKYQDCIDLAVCGSITVDMNNDNKDCGTVYLRYYENPEQILTFANYNAYIRISEMDDLNP